LNEFVVAVPFSLS